MIHYFASKCGLGDCLLHCHWMRKAALANPKDEFVFHAPEDYGAELYYVVADLIPQIAIRGINDRLPPANEANIRWVPLMATDMPSGSDLNDFIGCKVIQYQMISSRMGIESPINDRQGWLFDYPALDLPILTGDTDFLIINSRPNSGQFDFDGAKMAKLILSIVDAGHRPVLTSVPSQSWEAWARLPHKDRDKLSMKVLDGVTKIARYSRVVPNILMVATGPCWPTFNHRTERPGVNRVILCNQRVDFGRAHPHAATWQEAEQHLKDLKLI